MRQPVTLPPIWRCLEGKVRFVQQISQIEYSATCPACGGEEHPGGEWPDRFRIFVDGHPTAWCRKCSHLVFPDQLDGSNPPSSADLDKWRKEQMRREEERKRSAERALALLRDEQRWARYHDQMTTDARGLWRGRGIPDTFQDWWQLGYCAEFRVMRDGQASVTDTLTIPIFNGAWGCENIKHRLLRPLAQGDKYRYELSGQGQPLFLANPDEPLDGHVVAVEGEIKAAVTFVHLDDSHAHVVGLPGATPSKALVGQFAQAERVTLVMDPGARGQGIDLARKIGLGKTWLLIPPQKIDDGILAEGMGTQDVRRLLGGALPLAHYVRK